MRRLQRFFRLGLLVAVTAVAAGCSSYTSIERQPNGQYILTGWQAPGPRGFVWICEYDPDKRTLTVVEER